MKFRLYFFITAILVSHFCNAQDWKVFPYNPSGSKISFPVDEGRHVLEPIEWWYTSGHLTSATQGKTYSFMITYFYYPANTFDGFRILNVTDDATGKFYQDTKPVNYKGLSSEYLDIKASVFAGGEDTWSNKLNANNNLIPFEYTIKASSSTVRLYLNYTSLKRPLILGDNGYLEQGLNNYTYYYSQTRNAVSGKLTLDNVSVDVTGVSWIDRQYGNFNPLTGEKYEWFHMQLSNGMDINLWNVFTKDNKIPEDKKYRILSAYVNDSTQYTTSDLKIERFGYNWMPDGQICYSTKWRLTSSLHKIDLVFTNKNDNTEVKWPFRFFEGAILISGTVDGSAVTGFGFAELLHSYEHPVVIIENTDGGVYDISLPLSWKLTNPDDGRPVAYDLEYSINDKASFTPIIRGIKDTFFLWNNSTLSNGDKVWFKITAYTVDDKLHGTAVSKLASTVAVSNPDKKIRMFPNPVDDNFFLMPAFQMNNPPCRIIDLSGRVVHVFKRNSIADKIDVTFLQRGLYFFKIDSGKEMKILKFFKK